MQKLAPHDAQALEEWRADERASDAGETAYREAARKLLFAFTRAMGFLKPDDAESYMTRWWSVQFAFGTLHCEGRTMTQVAEYIGVGRAAISKGATEVCRACKIEPSFYMKAESTQDSYREKRKEQLTK